MNAAETVERLINKHQHSFFDALTNCKLLGASMQLNLSVTNQALPTNGFSNAQQLQQFIDAQLTQNQAGYAFGGYLEQRNIYDRSEIFQQGEKRDIHLGVDVWAPAGTPIYNPIGGMVHSTGYWPQAGNYGGTVLISYQLEATTFYVLYGHLSKASAYALQPGQYISRQATIGQLGTETENGDWPPHLHCQVIADIGLMEGDYPGVCSQQSLAYYTANCANAAPWLGITI